MCLQTKHFHAVPASDLQYEWSALCRRAANFQFSYATCTSRQSGDALQPPNLDDAEPGVAPKLHIRYVLSELKPK